MKEETIEYKIIKDLVVEQTAALYAELGGNEPEEFEETLLHANEKDFLYSVYVIIRNKEAKKCITAIKNGTEPTPFERKQLEQAIEDKGMPIPEWASCDDLVKLAKMVRL